MAEDSRNREPNDSTRWDLLEHLYFEGLHLSPSSRTELLAPYRVQNQELVHELETLWAHEPHNDSLFENLPRISRSFWRSMPGEGLPTRIGPYQVIEILGYGGMGVVYKAREPSPLSRLVAVKVLPSSLHAPAWHARFEMEQKSLSAMSHPNIATVHDAGRTLEDRPFLVMELLEGLPITNYCDTHRLSIDERLALFVQVCEGVSHAHRRGFIHRDLKPANVLVIEQDGNHIPKIIDFGIAGSLDVATPIPGGAVIGTPAYMSPEQAAHQRDKIDSRGDIYALGALLFELLAGKPPLRAQLREAVTFREQCRVVYRYPPEPLAQQARHLVTPEIAALRATTVSRVSRRLRGELSWITMKALARTPEDRYGSCSELIDDLHRFRKNRPVAAAPERTWYRLEKWLNAHKLLVGSGLTLLTVLVLALIISLVSLRAVRTSERHLRNVHAFSESIFREVGPYYQGRHVKVFELLDDAARGIDEKYADQPELERSIRLVLARSYHDLGLYEDAEDHFARACELVIVRERPDDAQALALIGERAYNLFLAGDEERALNIYMVAVNAAEERYGRDHPTSLMLSNGYAFVLGRMGRVALALALFETTLAEQRRVLGPTHRETLSTLNNLGDLLVATGQYAVAEQLLVGAIAAYEAKKSKMDPYAASLMHNLAFAFSGQQQYAEAIELGQQLLAIRNEMLGDYHPDSLSTANNLAIAIGESGSAPEAIELLRATLAGLPDRAKTFPEYLKLRHNLGHFLMIAQVLDEAELVLCDTWHKRAILLGAGHLDTLKTHFTLGEVLRDSGQQLEALHIFREVVTLSEQSLDPTNPYYKIFHDEWRSAELAIKFP